MKLKAAKKLENKCYIYARFLSFCRNLAYIFCFIKRLAYYFKRAYSLILFGKGITMIIRPATIMRNDYNLISEYAHQSGEIVYLTKYGKGDLVVMSIKTFEQREEKFKFYHTVMQADLDRQKVPKSF